MAGYTGILCNQYRKFDRRNISARWWTCRNFTWQSNQCFIWVFSYFHFFRLLNIVASVVVHGYSPDCALRIRDNNNVVIPIELLRNVVLMKMSSDNFLLHVDIVARGESKTAEPKKLIGRTTMSKSVSKNNWKCREKSEITSIYYLQSLQVHLAAHKLKRWLDKPDGVLIDTTIGKIIRASCEYLKVHCGPKPLIDDQNACAILINLIFPSISIQNAATKISNRLKNARSYTKRAKIAPAASEHKAKTPTDESLLGMIDFEAELDKSTSSWLIRDSRWHLIFK